MGCERAVDSRDDHSQKKSSFLNVVGLFLELQVLLTRETAQQNADGERNAKGVIIKTATLPCHDANAARRLKTTLRKRIPGWMRVAGRGQRGQGLLGTVRMYVLHSVWDTIR